MPCLLENSFLDLSTEIRNTNGNGWKLAEYGAPCGVGTSLCLPGCGSRIGGPSLRRRSYPLPDGSPWSQVFLDQFSGVNCGRASLPSTLQGRRVSGETEKFRADLNRTRGVQGRPLTSWLPLHPSFSKTSGLFGETSLIREKSLPEKAKTTGDSRRVDRTEICRVPRATSGSAEVRTTPVAMDLGAEPREGAVPWPSAQQGSQAQKVWPPVA